MALNLKVIGKFVENIKKLGNNNCETHDLRDIQIVLQTTAFIFVKYYNCCN